MRKVANNIGDVKSYVAGLAGLPLSISINKGRKRVLRYSGSVLAVYPQVFTLMVRDEGTESLLSCSYSDLICGDVKLMQANK